MHYKFKVFLFLLAASMLVVACSEDEPAWKKNQREQNEQNNNNNQQGGNDGPVNFTGLKVKGRWFVDDQGVRHNLHGFAQTYSPWFNEQGSKWTNYDVAACLRYNKGLIDDIIKRGWKMDFVRLHMDPYWSNKPG